MDYPDLINMTCIQTAADAAVTLAQRCPGSQSAFVERMNQKAEELGCENTHFVNVMGLDDPNQYTSARDMYTITRYAMDNPKFVTIVRQESYTAKPKNKRESVTYPNSNGMQRSNSGRRLLQAHGVRPHRRQRYRPEHRIRGVGQRL